jgi:hypothetical protein
MVCHAFDNPAQLLFSILTCFIIPSFCINIRVHSFPGKHPRGMAGEQGLML